MPSADNGWRFQGDFGMGKLFVRAPRAAAASGVGLDISGQLAKRITRLEFCAGRDVRVCRRVELPSETNPSCDSRDTTGMKSILLYEDDRSLGATLRDRLGARVTKLVGRDEAARLKEVRRKPWDLIIWT